MQVLEENVTAEKPNSLKGIVKKALLEGITNFELGKLPKCDIYIDKEEIR